MKPQERDELAKHRKMESISAELARNKRMSYVALLLLAVANVVVLAVLVYHLWSHD
jgi:uncharacterized membrane protein YcfT